MAARLPGFAKRPWVLAILGLVMVAGGWMGIEGYLEHRACLRRGKALNTLVENLKKAAAERLKIGTHGEDALRFLKESGLSAGFYSVDGLSKLEGVVVEQGCVQIFGCGDEVTIVVDVQLDSDGRVAEAPKFDERLMDCM
jgi:hypothetical protein